MIRVLIADDHAVMREGIKLSLNGEAEIVGEATTGAEALQLVARVPCDVLLLDLHMPDPSGVELITRLLDKVPSLRILVFTGEHKRELVMRALQAGAVGYLTKNSNPGGLAEAIRKVAGGGRLIDPELVNSLVFAGPGAQSPEALLSARELQILRMIAGGLALGVIADRLCISPKTVSTHKMRLMEKLDIDNNAELVRRAIEFGLA